VVVTRLLTLLIALLSATPAAWAHAFLAGATPSAGSQFAVAPPRLTLRFTEPVEPVFCTIELLDPAGRPVPLPGPAKADGNPQVLTVTLPRLGAGAYTVIWHVTSVDTHKTEGRYQFTIGP
jgi:methionine-rich copper-binding protein CopC